MENHNPAQGEPPSGQVSATVEAVDWAAWLEEFGPRLFLFARQQLQVDEDAEDVMQESLVQLVRAVEDGSFRGDRAQYAAFVYSTIRHRAKDLIRREANMREKHRRLRDATTDVVQTAPWLESSLDDAYLRNNVENLLRTLPGTYAEVIVLRIWGEDTFQQIAEMTGAATSTVSSRFRYALQVLRRKLMHTPDPPTQP